MQLAVEVFGWVMLAASALFGIFLLCMYLYLEVWSDGLSKRWNEPKVCHNCRSYKFDLVPHCEDCVERAQRKLGEKW